VEFSQSCSLQPFEVSGGNKNLFGVFFNYPGSTASFWHNKGIASIENMGNTFFFLNNITEFELWVIVFPAACGAVPDTSFKVV